MTREQLSTLLSLLPARWRLFFWLLAATGLRISEATALQWRDLRLEGRSPHIKVRRGLVKGRVEPPKSRYGRREVPLEPALVSALRARRGQKEGTGHEEDLVFATATGAALSPGNLRRRVLKPVAAQADVPWVRFHAFRHTCASMLFAEGRNAVQVQRWLGHHSAAFTLATYIHLLDGDVGEPLSLDTSPAERRPRPQRGFTLRREHHRLRRARVNGRRAMSTRRLSGADAFARSLHPSVAVSRPASRDA